MRSYCGGNTFLRRSRNRTHIQLATAPWWLLVRPRCRGLHRIHSVASEATPPRSYLHAHVLHYKRHSTNMAPKTGSACVERVWSLSCQDPIHAHLKPLFSEEGASFSTGTTLLALDWRGIKLAGERCTIARCHTCHCQETFNAQN